MPVDFCYERHSGLRWNGAVWIDINLFNQELLLHLQFKWTEIAKGYTIKFIEYVIFMLCRKLYQKFRI